MGITASKAGKRNGFNPDPLERARLRRGKTYAELGKAIGKTTAAVRFTCIGQSAAVKTVAALAEVLQVDPASCWPDPAGDPQQGEG